MPRTKKTETAEIIDQNPEEIQNSSEIKAPIASPEEADEQPQIEVEENIIEEGKIPANVSELMRLNPQYEKIWVTPKGFVHPEGVPEYLLKGAKLYNNKYFNN